MTNIGRVYYETGPKETLDGNAKRSCGREHSAVEMTEARSRPD